MNNKLSLNFYKKAVKHLNAKQMNKHKDDFHREFPRIS